MWLNELWFVLIAVLWIGFLVLEGFDFGVGALLPIIGRDDRGRRVLINTIGPIWDGNEVWLVTAAGAMFAAFPMWYATLFSGFYLPLLLVVVLLIIRGVAFEYRAKGHTDRWRSGWDASIIVASWGLPVLFGVLFGNLVRGVPLDASGEFAGTLLGLLNPFALATGLVTLLLCLAHGAVFLGLKTKGEIRDRARTFAVRMGAAAALAVAGLQVWQGSLRGNTGSLVFGVIAPLAMVGAVLATRAARDGWAFAGSALAMLSLAAGWFTALHPAVMPSDTDPALSLTLANAASSHYTLTVMSWVAVCLLPFVLGYQAWSYWVFRRRISVAMIPPSPGAPAASAGSAVEVGK